MISYFNRNNRHAYNRSMFIFSIWSSNSSSFIIEVKVVAPIKVEEKTITYNDPIVPTSYVEKPPFPVSIKDHAKASTVVRKSNTRTPTPPEKIKVEPSIAMVKDLLVDNIDGHVIYFCNEAARIARHDTK